MAFNDNLSDDYQTVAERIKIFREKHPQGSLRPADLATPFQILNIGNEAFVVIVAAAYRTPDDPAPGIGTAWQVIPGQDEYSFGSEIMIAETSAWGRAIVASMAADSRKIASKNEVERAQASRNGPAKKVAATAPKAVKEAAAPKAVKEAAEATPIQATIVTTLPAPTTHDATDDATNRAVIEQAMLMLQKPETTTQEVRDLWNVLSQARLLAWRVEPLDGVPADDDGKVTIGTLVAALGRAKAEA